MTELNSAPAKGGSGSKPIASDHNAPMRVEMVLTARLKLDPESVRTFSREDLKSAKRILKRFHLRMPLVADAKNRVLIGEILLLAAGELEIGYLPVVRLEHLDRLECQAISVAYSRLGELGSFDEPKLKELMLRFDVELPSFELEDLGFQTPMIDVIMESELEEKDEALPKQEAFAVSQVGDLWDLGVHRVLNGNARDPASYATLLQGRKMQAVFTDPPFGCPVDGFVSTKGKHREFADGTSGMTPCAVWRLLLTTFDKGPGKSPTQLVEVLGASLTGDNAGRREESVRVLHVLKCSIEARPVRPGPSISAILSLKDTTEKRQVRLLRRA